MTVSELKERCDKAIADGNGDKEIVICISGDEFYWLTGGFSSPVYNSDYIYRFLEDEERNEDDVIVLN